MKFLKFTFVFLLISVITRAQEKTTLLDSLFTTMNEREQFYGSVLIAEQNEIIYSKSFGLADREKKAKLNEQTLFNVGSVSKAFTAIAILQLAEQNELNLLERVVKYLPDFPYPDITIHHLLIHAGGLPGDGDLLKNSDWDNSKIATNKDVLSALYEQKPELQFTPGEKCTYSNFGYIVLAEIIESVSGLDFKEYLHKNIFERANMTRTNIYDREEIKKISNVAKGYLFYPFTGKYEEAITIPEFSSNYVVSGFQGDGNVYSSTIDLFKFYEALSNNTLIMEGTLKSAFQKHISSPMNGRPDFGHSWGYGWLILNTPKQIVYRGGGLQGYVSNTFWNITDDRVIIYLINDYLSYTSYHDQIPISIAGILNQNKLEVPKLLASIELSKIAVTSTITEMENKIMETKGSPDLYTIDVNGLRFLVHKLKELQQSEKAELVMKSFSPE